MSGPITHELPLQATQMSAVMESGDRTSRQIVEESIVRAGTEAADAALTVLTADRALTEASLSDSRRTKGELLSSLDGVPITWKDVFEVEGEVTTSGSQSRTNMPPSATDSWLVQRAKSFGLVTVGKTNLSEFAFSGLGINQYFGTPKNPNSGDEALAPGGSSSGAAAAVAAGISPLAVGTDTSGSVRIPAAFCGLVGFRASSGRYGPADYQPLSKTLDSVGVLARSTKDIRALDKLLGPGLRREPGRPALRAVIPEGEWIEDCTPEVYGLFTQAIEDLRSSGMKIETRSFSSMRAAQYLMDTHGTIVGAEAAHLHKAEMGCNTVEPATKRRLARSATGTEAVSEVYRQMGPLRAQFIQELSGAALICPTVRHTPPAIAALDEDPLLYDATNARTLRSTMLLSYLGACGVSLPLRSESGVAYTGLLLSLPEGSDESLLELAEWSEQRINVHSSTVLGVNA